MSLLILQANIHLTNIYVKGCLDLFFIFLNFCKQYRSKDKEGKKKEKKKGRKEGGKEGKKEGWVKMLFVTKYITVFIYAKKLGIS